MPFWVHGFDFGAWKFWTYLASGSMSSLFSNRSTRLVIHYCIVEIEGRLLIIQTSISPEPPKYPKQRGLATVKFGTHRAQDMPDNVVL